MLLATPAVDALGLLAAFPELAGASEDEDLPNLFTRFYQVARAHEGTKSGLGLGLYIAQELITAHQGRIDVLSAPGEGTTFTVRLPMASRP